MAHIRILFVRILFVATGALAVAGCSSMMPSFDLFSTKPTTLTLTIESDPPGADAQLSTGATCRTPCTQAVEGTAEFTVSYSLAGYTPQTVTVRPSNAEGASGNALLDPNPVFAQLRPTAPPSKAAPPKRKKRPPPPAAAAQAAPEQSFTAQPGAFAPSANSFTPVPGVAR